MALLRKVGSFNRDCPPQEVTRVINGDTFLGPTDQARLSGVDTLERGQLCYQEATDKLRELAGKTVRVETGSRETDRYGRQLYYVCTEDGPHRRCAR